MRKPSILDLSWSGFEEVDDGFSISYHFNGFLHRDNDLPAYKDRHGTLKWYKNGMLHRTKGPAIINTSKTIGEEVYYLNGQEIKGQDREDFKKLIKCNMSQVPLFINHPVLKDIAKERLNLNQ